jgi:hypothetical protein
LPSAQANSALKCILKRILTVRPECNHQSSKNTTLIPELALGFLSGVAFATFAEIILAPHSKTLWTLLRGFGAT